MHAIIILEPLEPLLLFTVLVLFQQQSAYNAFLTELDSETMR